MKTPTFLLTMLLSAVVSAQQHPTTGYAPVTLMERMPAIVPMVNDFFDAKPPKQ